MKTVFEMKRSLQIIGQEVGTAAEELRQKLMDPTATQEEIRGAKTRKEEAEERFNILQNEVNETEKHQRNKLQKTPITADSEEKRMVAAKAELIRSTILGRELSEETRNLLGAIGQSPSTGGEKFLPHNMSNELISEPFVKNPLRGVIKYTNIKGLEVPKIAYTLDDDDFITDAQTAKEIATTGDKVTFGNYKFKVYARISDTVLHGSDLNLTNYVEGALQSGLAAKEKKVAFAATPKTGEEHMSFYSTVNGITVKTDTTLYKAIKKAIADLHEDYRENAVVIMRYSDYSDMIETLANGNATLYNAQPEQILGKPVVFSDSATKPLIVDPNYVQFNYNGDMVYDSDKDVKAGEYLFVLTAWFDMQILLKSAVRIADVTPTP